MLIPQLTMIAAYSQPPPGGLICPVSSRIADHVRGRFVKAGVAEESISFTKDRFTFNTLIPITMGYYV